MSRIRCSWLLIPLRNLANVADMYTSTLAERDSFGAWPLLCYPYQRQWARPNLKVWPQETVVFPLRMVQRVAAPSVLAYAWTNTKVDDRIPIHPYDPLLPGTHKRE